MPTAGPKLTLDPQRVIETIAILQKRITERFPGAGLGAVCGELLVVARETSARAERIGRRHILLRLGLFALAASGIALLLWVLWALRNVYVSHKLIESVPSPFQGIDISTLFRGVDISSLFQGIDALANLLVLTGGILFFMVTVEVRLKRRQALAALYELRALVHVIDMHQLTKDPSTIISVGGNTPSSPARTLTPYEVSRYLDYCAEMLSLTSKIAVLYAQSLPDAIVTEAVSDIERIASGMSQKIWQKIMMLDAAIRHVPSQTSSTLLPARAGGVPATAGRDD